MFRWLANNEYAALEKSLGYRFRDRELLTRALMHRSYRFETDGVERDNQRLEFLGDAVLGFATAAYLFDHNREDDEGVLTSLRSQVTRGKALARIARDLDLGRYILLGKGEAASGGRRRDSSLEDALESIVGAAYLDGGMRAVDRLFKTVFQPVLETLTGDVWAHNPKGKLQEYTQEHWKRGPEYELIRQTGPAHAVRFTSCVRLPDGSEAQGEGASKQESERQAALQILRNLGHWRKA